MISSRRISLKGIPIALFIIGILVLVGLVGSNLIVDQSHQGEILLTNTQTLAYKMSATEWEMISSQTVEGEAEQTLLKTRDEIKQTLANAIALDPRNAGLNSANANLDNYLKQVEEEIQFLRSGNMNEAMRVDREKVDPAFESLNQSLTAAQATFTQRAGLIRVVTYTGSIILILIAGILIATLWSQNQQILKETLQATSEQEALIQASKHSEELSVYADALNRRNAQLQASANITRQTAGIQDTPELMNAVVNLMAEQFGYSHAGLYLLNEQKRIAFLQTASSQTGRDLVKQGFSIEIDKRHPFYQVVERGDPFFGSNTAETALTNDANFPLIRSRVILPLKVRGVVSGILDLHSEQPQVFSREDKEILISLAQLVAILIDNVRLLNETRALVSQLETYTSYQSKEAWQNFTSRHTPSYQYTPAGVRPIFSPAMVQNQDDSQSLKIPLVLQGQTIGAINLRRKGASASKWLERERSLVEKIAEQVALALENSRLVDEAQKNAQRDQMIANISSRVRETLDVESVIRTAATEIRRVFDLKEAEISIGLPQSEPPPLRKQTGILRIK